MPGRSEVVDLVEECDGVAVVRLDDGKVNALDLELLTAISATMARLVDVPAVVLTGAGTVFSAGVDLRRIVEGGPAHVREFLPELSRAFLAVFDHPRPVVAAVNGHALAGGCVLAAACDVRLMSGGRIGLTELLVGVPFPVAPLEIMRFAVGPAVAGLALTGRTDGPGRSEPDRADRHGRGAGGAGAGGRAPRCFAGADAGRGIRLDQGAAAPCHPAADRGVRRR